MSVLIEELRHLLKDFFIERKGGGDVYFYNENRKDLERVYDCDPYCQGNEVELDYIHIDNEGNMGSKQISDSLLEFQGYTKVSAIHLNFHTLYEYEGLQFKVVSKEGNTDGIEIVF